MRSQLESLVYLHKVRWNWGWNVQDSYAHMFGPSAAVLRAGAGGPLPLLIQQSSLSFFTWQLGPKKAKRKAAKLPQARTWESHSFISATFSRSRQVPGPARFKGRGSTSQLGGAAKSHCRREGSVGGTVGSRFSDNLSQHDSMKGM